MQVRKGNIGNTEDGRTRTTGEYIAVWAGRSISMSVLDMKADTSANRMALGGSNSERVAQKRGRSSVIEVCLGSRALIATRGRGSPHIDLELTYEVAHARSFEAL